MLITTLVFLFANAGHAQEPPADPAESNNGPPATLATTDLKEFPDLPADRKKLIAAALEEAKPDRWLKYKMAGDDPAEGGFDCSGAMYFVMRKLRMDPPRTAAGQLEWLEKNDRLHVPPTRVPAPDDAFFKDLTPGDLLFWGHSAEGDNPQVVTHVAMYLGREKKDGRKVMINATDGRSYRGEKANGYGVYDFYLPHENSRALFLGYGTPPGILENAGPKSVSPPDPLLASWEVVKKRVAQDDPELLPIIEQSFEVKKLIGSPGTAPFKLRAIDKQTNQPVILTIEVSDDHPHTKRYKFTVARDAAKTKPVRSAE
ncbi:MAG: NlpC/P60 family protein [Verrucomicrobiota bacterium]